ncbi:MAG: hypothetical protein R3343_06250 [Nitriliruptorales bacterium]|nr:hypothetical protein [Nitriliruptorales bacterium]
MKVQRVRPQVFELTVHALELSALVSAARWVVDGAEGDLPEEAREQLGQVLDSYDAEVAELNT